MSFFSFVHLRNSARFVRNVFALSVQILLAACGYYNYLLFFGFPLVPVTGVRNAILRTEDETVSFNTEASTAAATTGTSSTGVRTRDIFTSRDDGSSQPFPQSGVVGSSTAPASTGPPDSRREDGASTGDEGAARTSSTTGNANATGRGTNATSSPAVPKQLALVHIDAIPVEDPSPGGGSSQHQQCGLLSHDPAIGGLSTLRIADTLVFVWGPATVDHEYGNVNLPISVLCIAKIAALLKQKTFAAGLAMPIICGFPEDKHVNKCGMNAELVGRFVTLTYKTLGRGLEFINELGRLNTFGNKRGRTTYS